MKSKKGITVKKLIFVSLLAVLLFSFIPVRADITILSKTTYQSTDSFASYTELQKSYIKGNRSRNESWMKTKHEWLQEREKDSIPKVAIYDLDKQKSFALYPEEKTYIEFPFSAMKDLAAGLKELMGGDYYEAPPQKEYRWTINIDRSDTFECISGFVCSGVFAKSVGIDVKSPADSVTIEYRIWYDTNLATGSESITFWKRYAQMFNMEEFIGQSGMSRVAPDYNDQIKCISDSLKSEKGFPIKTSLKVEYSNKMPVKKIKRHNPEEPDDDYLDKENIVYIMEVISIDTTSTENSKFELPSDYNLRGY